MTAKIRGPVVGSILFAIYAATAGRGVGWEDSAFLQLALATLGVPHGPGFPIYVLAGHVWLIPFAGHAAWAANLFSAAVMAAASVALLEVTLELFAARHSDRRSQISVWETVGAIGVILAWGTRPEVWTQAVRTEVYPLTLLCVLLTAWLSLRAERSHDTHPGQSRRASLGAFWAWGMGMAIHPLVTFAAATPWLIPALWRWRRNLRGLALAAGIAAIPFSAYLYPLLRGQIDGVWAWGSFHELAAILDYYLRRSAWAAVPAGQNSYLENLYGWTYTLASTWPVLLWIPLAAALYWLRRRWTFALSMASVLALVIWAAPFDRMNLDLWGYFLPFVALTAAGLGVALLQVIAFVRRQSPGLSLRSRQMICSFGLLVVFGWPAVSVMADRHIPDIHAGAAGFVNSISATLPEGATLIATEDNVLGVIEFVQRVEGIRPDLKVIAPGALRYPFYRRQVTSRFGDVVPPEWNEPDVWSSAKWNSEIQNWLISLPAGQDIFVQFDALPGLPVRRLQPAGYVYRVCDTAADVHWSSAWAFWQNDAQRIVDDPVGADIVGRWLFNFGAFALLHGQDQMGWEALVAAVEATQENPEMLFLLGNALSRAGRNQEAVSMFAAANDLAPYRTKYRDALAMAERPLALGPPK